MSRIVRLLEPSPALVEMKSALWPDHTVEQHQAFAVEQLTRPAEAFAAFLVLSDDDQPEGFAEASVRTDYVNGCHTSPVVFLEGIYVAPAARGRGVGRALVAAVAEWGRSLGLSEFASDALLDNLASHRFHAAVGFAETDRVVYFRQPLQG